MALTLPLRGEGRREISPVYAWLWGLSLLLIPFYFGPSGLPQAADVLILVLAIVVLLRHGWRTEPSLAPLLVLLAAFVAYVSLVALGWGALTGRGSVLVKPVYYAFNAIAFTTLLVLYSQTGRSFLRVTLWAVSASVALQVGASFLLPPEGLRHSLFFNNPNQLGYFTLLVTALFAYGTRRQRVHPLHEIGFYAAVLYLSVLALSKAALLGMAVVFGLLALRRPVLVLLLTALAAVYLAFAPSGRELQANAERRIASVGRQDDDSLAGRGYDRIANHAVLVFLGAGEGAYDRFDSEIAGKEMHSTWGTVLFSYGLPGSALLLVFLGLLFLKAGPMAFLYFLPVVLYGLTHNGGRFTLMWILLAFLACAALEERRAREGATP